jgi:PASTA domain
MERRHLLLVSMAAAAGLGAAGAAAIVAADDDRATANAVTITLAQTTTQIATQEAPPPTTATEPATTEQTGVDVPPLIGLRLDEATTALDEAGLAREVDGGGLFGVLDDTQWFVCDTSPTAGSAVDAGSVVVVYVDRDCLA